MKRFTQAFQARLGRLPCTVNLESMDKNDSNFC